MLQWRSAYEDKTPTVRFVTLENSKSLVPDQKITILQNFFDFQPKSKSSNNKLLKVESPFSYTRFMLGVFGC